MSNEEKLALLAEMLEVETEDLSPDMKLSELDEWDSFARLSFMSLVDDNYGKLISSADIKKYETVADLLAVMTETEE